ncbi:MAG: hypothetical protein CM15mV39_0290 [uncultured marine virus]|nr:MAG: hypothetical protein CM15mV39_0290 [uncultured marine virus]
MCRKWIEDFVQNNITSVRQNISKDLSIRWNFTKHDFDESKNIVKISFKASSEPA